MITLRPNEKIYLIKRRHWLILMRSLLPEFLIFLATIILMITLIFIPLPSWPNWLTNFIPSILELEIRYLSLFLLSLFLLVIWTISFLIVTNYYLDCWIVTNERTIHTELRGLFSRIFSSINHDKIQDITIEIQGFFPAILRFGDLYIQTAGEFREFVFRQIPQPHKTRVIIFKAQKEFLKRMKKDGVL
ncbi:PH domain-containing protein [Patescibacteria group bacterium]|nr:PH domain-containing protein [Patescibacteria group bacterium]